MIKITVEIPHGHPAMDNLNGDWEAMFKGETPRVFLTVGGEGKEDVIIPVSGIVSTSHSCEMFDVAYATIEFIAR